MSVIGIDHVLLAAPPGCEEKARWFFVELLGLVELGKPEPLRSRGGLWFAAGNQQLHVGVEAAFAPARKAHPALRVAPADLDELASRLVEAGISVTWDESLPDSRRFFCADPWGNRIELLAAQIR